MNDQIDIIRKSRAYLLEAIKELSIEQLNKIPAGFNNNIIWNLGHLVAAQQGICYVRTGLTPTVDEGVIDQYKKGTRPDKFLDEVEFEKIKDLLFSSLDAFKRDYKSKLWKEYSAWTTSYGVELNTIDDALQFVNFHEGLHAGGVLALKRCV